MKYIQLYLEQRKKEIETMKKENIEKFKKGYLECKDDRDFELLLEETAICYYIDNISYDEKLIELQKLKEDLILESKGDN